MNISLQTLVDKSVPPEQSLLLRYHSILATQHPNISLSKEDLTASTISEGAHIFPLAHYQGVNVWVCDESSLMATGTYKDLDACLMAAIARHSGLKSIVLSSGGNLGYAMARYARKAGLTVYFFHPKSTLYKLDAANFAGDSLQVITVDRPEKEVKQLARAFADVYGIAHVPSLDWRFAASSVRAMHIAERLFMSRTRVDWLAQTICAGFGPVGIYDSFSWLIEQGLLAPDVVPPFLGIQQAANAPIVRAWQNGAQQITGQDNMNGRSQRYIEPGLYNTNPNVNYANLNKLLASYGGAFLAVEREGYTKYEETVTGWFRDAGLEFTKLPHNGEILERAGILTGVGIMQTVEQGLVKRGACVLYLLTGGFRQLSSFERLQPDIVIDETKSIASWVHHLGQSYGLRPRQAHHRGSDAVAASQHCF